jgi:protein-disulfide isomerase
MAAAGHSDTNEKQKNIVAKKVIKVRGVFIPSIGAKSPSLIIIVYTDCLCPACYETLRYLNNVSKRYKSIRIVYKELPIHGKLSIDCSAMALAAHAQRKYWAFKSSAEQYFKNLSGQAIPNCWTPAIRAGLNINMVKKIINNKYVMQELKENFDEIKTFVSDPDTPMIIVGKTVIKGDLSKDKLESIIKKELYEKTCSY